MKKLIVLSLVCCLVLAMSTPVSAGYWEKDVSADDFVNALVAYCNHNEVHNMTKSEFELSNHNFRSFNVTRTLTTFDFDFECDDVYTAFLVPIPITRHPPYKFTGHMHVNYLDDLGVLELYGLAIYDSKRNFSAWGLNWILSCENYGNTRFYANDDEPNRLYLLMLPSQTDFFTGTDVYPYPIIF